MNCFELLGKNNTNLIYFILFAIAFFFVLSSNDAYAVNSINWTQDGNIMIPNPGRAFPHRTFFVGYIPFDFPVTIQVDATDESDFILNNVIDTLDVVVTSPDEPTGIIYTLTETGPNDGIFTGTNFIFLKHFYRFQATDSVDLTLTVDPIVGCDIDNTITQLDSRSGGSGDGFVAYSETDPNGLGLVLIETGENTCTFVGQLKFSPSGPSDETTGTLLVSQGDIVTFKDEFNGTYYNSRIIPELPGKGSIFAHYEEFYDESRAVIASYNGLTAGLVLMDDGTGGSGFGGPVRPGLVLNVIASLLNGGSNPSAPPTLGLDQNQKRIVEEGFSFNGNPVDVEQFYTPYPLITTEVGQLNTVKLKIYENNGPDNIAHIGLSYGLGKGEIFNEGRATIEFDRTFDGVESVSLFDPHDVLGGVNVTTSTIQCSASNNAQCLEVTFDHIFRESLEYNMVSTNIWDFERNGWQNYFNHGIEIVGESMNPPEEYSGIFKGKIYHLTETGKDRAVDDEGNYWTFDKTWNRDYIKPVKVDIDILNPKKIEAIEQLGFDYSDGKEIFGFDRLDHRFNDLKNQQEIVAQNIMNNLCPECQNEFGKINNIFSYDLSNRYSRIDSTINLMQLEDQKAKAFLKIYFDHIYPGRIDD
jgi:hypothetical protein